MLSHNQIIIRPDTHHVNQGYVPFLTATSSTFNAYTILLGLFAHLQPFYWACLVSQLNNTSASSSWPMGAKDTLHSSVFWAWVTCTRNGQYGRFSLVIKHNHIPAQLTRYATQFTSFYRSVDFVGVRICLAAAYPPPSGCGVRDYIICRAFVEGL